MGQTYGQVTALLNAS